MIAVLSPVNFLHLSGKLYSARDRCKAIARSEMVLGYTESSILYASMTQELDDVREWVGNRDNFPVDPGQP